MDVYVKQKFFLLLYLDHRSIVINFRVIYIVINRIKKCRLRYGLLDATLKRDLHKEGSCKFVSHRPKKRKALKTDKTKQSREDTIDFAGDNKDMTDFAGDTGKACHCSWPLSF
jgi:hypothetical protein